MPPLSRIDNASDSRLLRFTVHFEDTFPVGLRIVSKLNIETLRNRWCDKINGIAFMKGT
jgi:hypothetical protein